MSESRFQTFGPRLYASLIDGLIFFPLVIVDTIVFGYINLRWLSLAWMPITYLSFVVYDVILHARSGQTVGKRIAKVRVVDSQTEGPITWLQAVMRESPLITANVIALVMDMYVYIQGDSGVTAIFAEARIALTYATLAWVVLELASCLFNEKRHALHDFIGGTVVVKTD